MRHSIFELVESVRSNSSLASTYLLAVVLVSALRNSSMWSKPVAHLVNNNNTQRGEETSKQPSLNVYRVFVHDELASTLR